MEPYGGVHRDEMEVMIRLDQQDGQAHICSTWPEWSRKLEKRFGRPGKHTARGEHVTSAFWAVPLHCVTIRTGKRQVVLTPEQRQAVGDRFAKARQARRTVIDSSTTPPTRHP